MNRLLKPIALIVGACLVVTQTFAAVGPGDLDSIPSETDSFSTLSRTSSLDSSIYVDVIEQVEESATAAAVAAGIQASWRFFAPGSLTRNQKNNLFLGLLAGYAGGVAARLLIAPRTTIDDPGLHIDAIFCKALPTSMNQFASMSQTALARIEDRRLETKTELGLGVLMALSFGLAGAACSVEVQKLYPPRTVVPVTNQLDTARTWYTNFIDQVGIKKTQWTTQSTGYCLFDCSVRNNAVAKLNFLRTSELNIYRILAEMEVKEQAIRDNIATYHQLHDRQAGCLASKSTTPECMVDLTQLQVNNFTNAKILNGTLSELALELSNVVLPFIRTFAPLPAILFPAAPGVGGGGNAYRVELRR